MWVVDIFLPSLATEYSATSFWLDLRISSVAPVGGTDRSQIVCRPPKVVCQHRAYLGKLVEQAKKALPSPSRRELTATGIMLKDRFPVGHWLEVIDNQQPNCVWPAVATKNIGGRLLLRQYASKVMDCLPFSDTSTRQVSVASWIFCTDRRLQAVGWGLEAGFQYAPPSGLPFSEKEVAKVKAMGKEQSVFNSSGNEGEEMRPMFTPFTVTSTKFAKGYYVEFLHPVHKQYICPAKISDAFQNGTIAVEILDFRPDGMRESIRRIRSSLSYDVLPVHWAAKHGLQLYCPGRPGIFDWTTFLSENTGGKIAPENWFGHLIPLRNLTFINRFHVGMRLEASHPGDPEEICAATIVKIILPLLWIRRDQSAEPDSSHIEVFNSTELFPVGFCSSHDYPMLLPPMVSLANNDLTKSEPSVRITVYINPRCNCGPFINEKKLLCQAQWIGPGPIELVMEKVIITLISSGMKHAKLLQMISAVGELPKSQNWNRIGIWHKIDKRRILSCVDIVKYEFQVSEFLRGLCLQFATCPNLLTTNPLSGPCQERCDQFLRPKRKKKKNAKAKRMCRPKRGGHAPERHGSSTGSSCVSLLQKNSADKISSKSDDLEFTDEMDHSIAESCDLSLDEEPCSVDSDIDDDPVNEPVHKRIKTHNDTPASRHIPPKSPSEQEDRNFSHSDSPEDSRWVDHASQTRPSSSSSSRSRDSVNQTFKDTNEIIRSFYRNPACWTVQNVYDVLSHRLPTGCPVPDILKQEGVDGDVLLEMVASDLKYLDLPDVDVQYFGHVLEQIILLRTPGLADKK